MVLNLAVISSWTSQADYPAFSRCYYTKGPLQVQKKSKIAETFGRNQDQLSRKDTEARAGGARASVSYPARADLAFGPGT